MSTRDPKNIWWAWDAKYPNGVYVLAYAPDRDQAIVAAQEVLGIVPEVIDVERPLDALIAERDGFKAEAAVLREVLEEIAHYTGGADSPLEDEYVMERLRAFLAEHDEARDAERGLVPVENPSLAQVMGTERVEIERLRGEAAALREVLETVDCAWKTCDGNATNLFILFVSGASKVGIAARVRAALTTDAGKAEAEVIRRVVAFRDAIPLPNAEFRRQAMDILDAADELPGGPRFRSAHKEGARS